MKCTKCGVTIKNVYYVDGKPYGVECFKTVLGMKREKQAKEEYTKYQENLQKLRDKREQEYLKQLESNKTWADIIIEVLRSKNMKNIKNEYKLNLYNDTIEFYNEYNSLDNDLIGACNNYLITTKKDRQLFNRMLLESYTDDELIENINNMFLYNYDGIEEELNNKFEYLINKYEYTIEEYQYDKVYKINDTIIREMEIE